MHTITRTNEIHTTSIHIAYLPASTVLSFLSILNPSRPTLFPYTTLFRSTKKTPSATSRTRKLPCRRCFPTSSTSKRWRSEEHTSELQSRRDLVCRLLLEKKK